LTPRVHLRRGRGWSPGSRHPWIFSGAIARVSGEPVDGDEVLVVDADGTPVARGLWNGQSQIQARVYGHDPDRPLDRGFWEERIDAALALRAQIPELGPDAPQRLVFSEADGLSGLIVDRMGPYLVVQVSAFALHQRLDPILDVLEARFQPAGILLRTEKGTLEAEGLVLQDGCLRGEEPAGPIEIEDGELRFQADLRTGQKTGFYLDQRENRRRVARWAAGRRCADVCCYSGAFALHLAKAGAREIVGVDVSAPALTLAQENAARNGVETPLRWVRSDALGWLREEEARGHRHDLIVLDPPRFARSRRGVPSALLGYQKLNEAAVRILEPGGILATFSCSGRVDRASFQEVLAEVSRRTARRIRILDTLGQPPDHPVDPATPETAYLKGLILAVE
jgi:23S rRNA (cytosine1962-C5)-methyltransferase